MEQEKQVEQKPSLFKKAQREKAWLKIGITGVSGGGKTYGALLLASGMARPDEKICLIDTENGSSNLYSDLCNYDVLAFNPPFSPQRYIKAIEAAQLEGYKFCIIDSISHEWDGAGGCLDIHNRLGGKFQDWAKVTPMHKEFIDAILQCKMHVIVTMRRKQDYAMVLKDGKNQVEKLGLKEIQRDGFEYELTLNLNVESNHMVMASKDRTKLFKDNIPITITKETGKMIRDWNENG